MWLRRQGKNVLREHAGSISTLLKKKKKNLTISEAEPTLSNLFVHSFIIYCKIKKKKCAPKTTSINWITPRSK